MAAFPDILTVRPEDPEQKSLEYNTLVSSFDNGEERRKQKRLFTRRTVNVNYNNIDKSEIRTLWRFFQDRKGKFEAFNLFLPFSDDYVEEYVGVGDGSQTNWNAPSKNASSVTIYVDGTVQTNYTFTTEGGADGADLIAFDAAPAAGEHITMDFSGRLKIRSRFQEDRMSWKTFINSLGSTGIEIQGLLNE